MEDARKQWQNASIGIPGRFTYVDPLRVRSPKLRAEFLEAYIKAGSPE